MTKAEKLAVAIRNLVWARQSASASSVALVASSAIGKSRSGRIDPMCSI